MAHPGAGRVSSNISSTISKLLSDNWPLSRWLKDGLIGKLLKRVPMLDRRFAAVLYACCVNKPAKLYAENQIRANDVLN
jgi:hypothetical protein